MQERASQIDIILRTTTPKEAPGMFLPNLGPYQSGYGN